MDEWPGNMDLRNLLLYLLIHTMAPFSRGSLVSLFTPNSAPTLVTCPFAPSERRESRLPRALWCTKNEECDFPTLRMLCYYCARIEILLISALDMSRELTPPTMNGW